MFQKTVAAVDAMADIILGHVGLHISAVGNTKRYGQGFFIPALRLSKIEEEVFFS